MVHMFTPQKNKFGELKIVCQDCGHEADYEEAIDFFMIGMLTGNLSVIQALSIAMVLNFDDVAANIPDEVLEG